MTISIAQMSDRVFSGLAKRTTGMVFDAELTVTEPGTYDPATATYQAEGDVYLGGEIDTDFTELQEFDGGDATTDYTDLDTYDFSGGDAEVSIYPCRLLVAKTPKDGQIGTYIVTEKSAFV